MSEQDRIVEELEFLIHSARDGKVSVETVFQVLMRAPVWVLLNKELEEGDSAEGVQALVMEGKNGEQLVALFTDTRHTKAIDETNPGFSHPRQVSGAGLLDDVGSGVGIVINPGTGLSMQIKAEGLAELKNGLGKGLLRNIPVDAGTQPAG